MERRQNKHRRNTQETECIRSEKMKINREILCSKLNKFGGMVLEKEEEILSF